jgi:hypothetical protein
MPGRNLVQVRSLRGCQQLTEVSFAQEREQKRLREIHQKKIKAAKSSVDSGTPARRRGAKKTGSGGKKTKKKIKNQLESSIADLDKLFKEQECWGPNFGRLSTIMEMSQDFEGTRINVLEECRKRCKRVKTLLDESAAEESDTKENDGESKEEEQAFVSAQEEAQVVKVMLDEIASSIKFTDGDALQLSQEQKQAEQFTSDTLTALQAVIDSLVPSDNGEEDFANLELDGFESKEQE